MFAELQGSFQKENSKATDKKIHQYKNIMHVSQHNKPAAHISKPQMSQFELCSLSRTKFLLHAFLYPKPVTPTK